MLYLGLFVQVKGHVHLALDKLDVMLYLGCIYTGQRSRPLDKLDIIWTKVTPTRQTWILLYLCLSVQDKGLVH